MVNKKIILHLCAGVGSDSKPYRDHGYDVCLVDKKIGVENYAPPQNVHGVIANPPCTEFSIAKCYRRNPEKGMFLVQKCLEIIELCSPTFWVMENPATGKLKDFLGAPLMVYQPWEFGSPWTKKTALWGEFNVPRKIYKKWDDVPKNDNLYIRPGRKKPSLAFLHKSAIKYIEEFKDFEVEDDMSFRSLCSQKFAYAFFDVNK